MSSDPEGGVEVLLPITLSIVGLLVVVATSYRRTIAASPRGGGAYTVARENLGRRVVVISVPWCLCSELDARSQVPAGARRAECSPLSAPGLQLFPLTRVKTFRFRRDTRRASPHVDCPRG
ncbi:hypothetical protein [Myxococcus fulvus]|uniref:hypothetical protein n=1 Tax=Myxococcus fulvus TaxID=33 RepID=UPI0020BE0390|nr:hypothetical protein [Myxococcus fulvus]MCK8503155.1 hypothetical protein [Myxococcus fulvus]